MAPLQKLPARVPRFTTAICLVAAFLFVGLVVQPPRSARASQLTATMTGIVTAGTDSTGYFVAPGGSLVGKQFTLVYTMDDTKGVAAGTWPACGNGRLFSGLSTPTPLTAVTINGATWTTGAFPPTSFYSDTGATQANYTSPLTQLSFFARDDLGYTTGLAGLDEIWGDISLNSANICRNWESLFNYTLVPVTDVGVIGVDVSLRNVSSLSYTDYFSATLSVAGISVTNPYSVTTAPPAATDPKTFGHPCCTGVVDNPPPSLSTPLQAVQMTTVSSITPNASQGDPVNAAVGNMTMAETDYTGPAFTQLRFARHYNSYDQTEAGLGIGWRSTYHRGLIIAGSTIRATREDGREDKYTLSGGSWTTDADVTGKLVSVGANYKLTLSDDSVENYNSSGQLTSIVTRAGLTTTFTYTSGNLTTVTGPFGQKLTFTYDASNRVATMKLPNGTDTFTYAYDANDNLYSVTNPDGTQRQYAHGTLPYNHLITNLYDEDGNPYAAWSYDSTGRAILSQHAAGVDQTSIAYTTSTAATVTDANGNAHNYTLSTVFTLVKPTAVSGAPDYSAGGKAFSYDANGFLSSRTDFDGNVTHYVHNALGEETSRTEAFGTALARSTSASWNATWHQPDYVYEPNRTTHFTYDAHGNMLTKSSTDSVHTRTWTYTYNTYGQVLTAKDPDNNTTTLGYTTTGGLLNVTNALSQTTTFTSYDAAGHVLSVKDPNGLVTAFTWDALGRMLTKTLNASLTTTYTWDPGSSKIATVAAPDASTITYSYDDAHRLIKVKDSAGDYITYTYDNASNVTEVDNYDPSSTLKKKHTYTYNAANLVLTDNGAALGETTTYGYDSQGNLLTAADPLSHVNTYTYDALNRPSTWKDALNHTTTSAYTVMDDLASVKDPRALVTSYTHDGLSDTTSLSSPDTGLTTNTYDAYGNLLTSTDARNNTASYAYDALNRTTTISYSGGSMVGFVYDTGTYGIGHLTQMVDPAGTTTWTHDIYGRVLTKKQVTGAVTLTTTYQYDGYGRVLWMQYPSGKWLDFTYDSSGRMNGIGYSLAVGGVTYFPFGPAKGWTEPNGATLTRTFDQDGRITGIALAGTTTGSNTQTITYDNASRITALSETATTMFPAKAYGYDNGDHLASFFNGTTTTSYTYDADSNRSSTVLAGTTTYNYPGTSNMLSSLSGATTASYTYDADGNMTGDGTNTYHYDPRGVMDSSTALSVTTSYYVNGFGQRIEKKGSTVPNGGTNYFVYDEQGHMIGEYDNTGAAIEETVYLPDTPTSAYLKGTGLTGFGANAAPVAVMSGASTVASITPDWLNGPHIIQNASKQYIWVQSSYPFGDNGPNQNPSGLGTFVYNLRASWQYADMETGNNYNTNRYLMHVHGTDSYNQPDPLGLGGGQLSLYPFVGQNPLTHVDPTGQDQGPFIPGNPNTPNPNVPIFDPSQYTPVLPEDAPMPTPTEISNSLWCTAACMVDELSPKVSQEIAQEAVLQFIERVAKVGSKTAIAELCLPVSAGLSAAELENAFLTCSTPYMLSTCPAH